LTPRRRSAEGGESGALLSNFFETEDTVHRYYEGSQSSGFPISIPDAIKVGRTVFADLMKEP
jgi:hypothetical protein